MKIILRQDIRTIGRRGEVKEVSDGYARNFLIPRKFADAATSAALALYNTQQQEQHMHEEKSQKAYQELAIRLKSMGLRFKVKVGEKGKAFGSIASHHLQEALAEQKIILEKNWILLDEPIKSTGEKIIPIELPYGIKSEIKITIEAE